MKPSRTLLLTVLLWASLGLAAVYFSEVQKVWVFGGVVLLLIAIVEVWGVWREPLLKVERKVAHSLPVGSWTAVQLVLHNAGQRMYRLAVFDHYPGYAEVQSLPLTLTLRPRECAQLEYKVRPTRRGDARFGAIEVQVHSRFGLWVRQKKLPCDESVKVYPNFAEVAKYALFATDNNLSQLGVRRRQRRGEGLEFHQLREYRQGDALRQIDWKATSRYRRLISREYQDERDQQVVFLLDCGRRMRAEDAGVNHFDQSLNAMLLLSYVALRQGDAAGFLAFGGIDRWFPPQKGPANINTMLNRCYDLQVTTEAADYARAAQDLLTRQRRRALVVILTNSRDEDQQELTRAVRTLRTRHLVLLANLREEFFDTTLQRSVHGFDDALRYAAVVDYLGKRRQVHDGLANSGAHTLDVTAPQLPLAVVNRYLDFKRGGRL